MTQIDPQMAQRVWQRVQGEGPASREGTPLQTLMEDAWEDAALYRQLARRHRGKKAAVLELLHRQIMEHLQLLKGICALSEECAPVFSPVPPRREPEGILLRRGYGRALQRLHWYAAGENDPRYGHLLAPLIRQTRYHTRLLLQLMSRPAEK